MSLRSFFTVLACFMFLVSCRDTENRNEEELNTEENEYSPVDRNIPRADVDEDEVEEVRENRSETSGNVETRDSNINKESGNQTASTRMTGQFIKTDQENDSNCDCYCLDLTSDAAELCLIQGEMYIDTRLQRNADNTIDIFLVEPSGRNNPGKDIPWKDFDRNNAIATIKPASNGELELDWLGFMINGDLAVDYAIYGKKTLEGNYKKK